jgi:4-hydroxythreonine-4-phosphate dehydrogenase
MTMAATRPPIVVTPGEPAGIGCEIAIKSWEQGSTSFCLIDCPDHVRQTADLLGFKTAIKVIDHPAAFDPHERALQIIPVTWPAPPRHGAPDSTNARQVIDAIAQAANWCLEGDAACMVTNPIQKSTLYAAGFTYPGHTEFLASFGPVAPGAPLMMLACKELRVVPATVHIPIKDVPAALTGDLIVEKTRLIHTSLQRGFGIDAPRIAICGLNPHAGESGTMGREDLEIIRPAIKKLKADGIDARGPYPADTLFHAAARASYDAVLGMYHDQVLIPLKTIDFYGGVNITLGLNFIRTSPDHGTGLDIAGKGIANPDSFMAAIAMADDLARVKRNDTGMSEAARP